MLDILFKKKVTEEQLATHFVNGIIQLVDQGFPEAVEIINSDTSLITSPKIDSNHSDEFLIIVMAGNLKLVTEHFNDYRDVRLTNLILKKLALTFEMSAGDLQLLIGNYQSYLSRVNHPSKNTLYAMSRAVFYKYNLNQHQAEYFRNMKTPNPILLKNLDQIMENFIWHWGGLKEKYRITK